MSITLHTEYKRLLADSLTPVSAYLRTRDLFPGAHLLESADFSSADSCSSYLLLDPIAEFKLHGLALTLVDPIAGEQTVALNSRGQAADALQEFITSFRPDTHARIAHGVFGFCTSRALDPCSGEVEQNPTPGLPDCIYQLFRYVIGINHLSGEVTLLKNHPNGATGGPSLDSVARRLTQRSFPRYEFRVVEDAKAATLDGALPYRQTSGCGDASSRVGGESTQRPYSTHKFIGDEFNVYRTLRSKYPSPYLFYFDFGSCKLMGSSPGGLAKTPALSGADSVGLLRAALKSSTAAQVLRGRDSRHPSGECFLRGGAVGYFGFDGSSNHVGLLRSALSLNGCIYFESDYESPAQPSSPLLGGGVTSSSSAIQRSIALAEELP